MVYPSILCVNGQTSSQQRPDGGYENSRHRQVKDLAQDYT